VVVVVSVDKSLTVMEEKYTADSAILEVQNKLLVSLLRGIRAQVIILD
jgi:hypothetical protein